MARKQHKPEEIVARLRQVGVLVAQGKTVAESARAIGVTEATYHRWRVQGGGGPHPGEAGAEGSGLGKLLSAARRRTAVEHVTAKLDVSERFACHALGQHRSTQRKAPTVPGDEAR